MDDRRESEASPWAWVLITVFAWPVWHWAFVSLSAIPLSWVASITPSGEGVPTEPGGIYDSVPQILLLATMGLLVGFLGVYLLRRLGAPRVVWIPAALVSLAIYVGLTVFWAGFSGSGTGAAHIARQFALTVGLSAFVSIGAWWGSRAGRSV